MNGETKLHESIMDMLTMLGAEDPLPAARVLEAAVKEAIEEGIEKLKAELVARLYPANEPQPEPPAPPAFAVGTRVRITTHPGSEGIILEESGLGGVYKVDCPALPFEWFGWNELEPLPSDPVAPAGALPAVTEYPVWERREYASVVEYVIGTFHREIYVCWDADRPFPNMELRVKESAGTQARLTINDDSIDNIIRMLLAIKTERQELKNGNA